MDPKKLSPEELQQLVHRELRALPPRRAPEGFEARLEARLAARALAPAEIERLVDRALRALPPRPAPASLEGRVGAALARRTALPWWRRGWSYWPASVRLAAGAGFAAAAAATVAAPSLLPMGLGSRLVAVLPAEALGLISRLGPILGWVVDFGSRLLASLPTFVLPGVLALVVGLYAALFGLGATAYRTLVRPADLSP